MSNNMSFNKEFLKTLTVLYVEDDDSIRKSLGTMLKKVFKDVITCNDGQDGLENYLLYTNEMDVVFDAVITDINMPNMNGLEMASEIRKENADIPIIMTTAHGESNYLLEAIKIGVSGYILKPIDAKELIFTIQRFCEIKKNQRLLVKKEAELGEYVDIINDIATLFKTDAKDNIIEVNDFFADMLEFDDKDELIGANIINYIHPNSIPKAYKKMKDAIKDGKKWKGKILFLSKEDEIVPLRVTNIPLRDDDTDELIGYISVGFLALEEEMEKKEITSKARKNIVGEKQKIMQLTKRIKELERQARQMANGVAMKDLNAIKDTYKTQKQQKSQLAEQVKYYEDLVRQLQARLNSIMDIESGKRKEIVAKLRDCDKDRARLQNELLSARAQINKLTPKPKYIE